MASTSFVSTDRVGTNLYQVDTVQQFPLGTLSEGQDATVGFGKFIYLKGVASTAEGSIVTYDEAFATALLAANAHAPVAVSLAATVADSYGWYQLQGKAAAKAVAGVVAGLCYACATAGSGANAAVAGDRVKGALFKASVNTPATGLAWVQLFPYPFMDDAAAA